MSSFLNQIQIRAIRHSGIKKASNKVENASLEKVLRNEGKIEKQEKRKDILVKVTRQEKVN